jgi:hypothetical protein
MRAIGPAICGAMWSASLSATILPFQLRINITFVFLALIGVATYILSSKLKPEDYETAHAREEVVHIQEEQENQHENATRS